MRSLVVDDVEAVRELIGSVLKREGYDVGHALDGEDALRVAARSLPDIVILDLNLPRLGGLEVCVRLRKWFRGPILVLSGYGDEATIVRAFDCGADDYLTKPFRTRELLARLRALIHRAPANLSEVDSLEVGDLRIDFARRRILSHGREIRLTRTEFEIVSFLAKNLERVVTRDGILQQIWGPHHGDYAQTLRVHVGHIRKKIEKDPASPRYLLTEPGVGYQLQNPEVATGARASSALQ